MISDWIIKKHDLSRVDFRTHPMAARIQVLDRIKIVSFVVVCGFCFNFSLVLVRAVDSINPDRLVIRFLSVRIWLVPNIELDAELSIHNSLLPVKARDRACYRLIVRQRVCLRIWAIPLIIDWLVWCKLRIQKELLHTKAKYRDGQYQQADWAASTDERIEVAPTFIGELHRYSEEVSLSYLPCKHSNMRVS